MKKPRQPNNYYFWLHVLNNPKEKENFLNKGNDRQKKELRLAEQYQKWEEIQERKR